MDKELPPRCVEVWSTVLRMDIGEMARLTVSERLRMFFDLCDLNRFVPEHPAYTRWREKEKQVVRERWRRIKDRLRLDQDPLAG